MLITPTKVIKNRAVIGAGPAGLAAANTAAQRGHNVTIFDSASELGGQFNRVKQIPGKEEFYETLRYYSRQIELHNVTVKLNTRVDANTLNSSEFDDVIIATGIAPQRPPIEGIEHSKVMSYVDVIVVKK